MSALDVRLHGDLVATVEDAAGRLRLDWAQDLLDRRPLGTPVLSVRLDAQPPDVHPPAALVRAWRLPARAVRADPAGAERQR